KNFNDQDKVFTQQTTNFTRRHKIKIYPMVRKSANDHFHTVWREYANENARGVGYAFRKATAGANESSETAQSEIASATESDAEQSNDLVCAVSGDDLPTTPMDLLQTRSRLDK